MSHEQWMRRCLELAARGEGRTSPNPMVGCVLVGPDGKLIAEGYHRKAGQAHAEVAALRRAGARARGATAYVSLEPCNHHGRTPPCAPQLAEAGVAAVVFGATDPIASHAGGGTWLRRRGVRVTGGVLARECREQNRGFFSVVERGLPFVTAKIACSLDGRIATASGESQWITGPAARRRGHELRNRLDAIVVGVGTVRADDPQLTARAGRRARDPVRVVVDSRLSTPSAARVLPANATSDARCIIATTRAATSAAERRLSKLGAEVWRLPSDRTGRVRLRALLQRLAREGVATVLAEGGAGLHTALVESELVDELALFMAPMAIGGAAPSWLAGKGVKRLVKAPRFAVRGAPELLGEDLALVLRRPAG